MASGEMSPITDLDVLRAVQLIMDLPVHNAYEILWCMLSIHFEVVSE